MKKDKFICHICDVLIKAEQLPERCPSCATNLANPNEEILQKHMSDSHFANVANLKVGAIGADLGELYLTNKRLFALKEDVKLGKAILEGVFESTGAIGGAIGGAVLKDNKWKISFEIPLGDVKSVEDSKFGLLVKAILVHTNDGASYKMTVPKREKDEWKAILTSK